MYFSVLFSIFRFSNEQHFNKVFSHPNAFSLDFTTYQTSHCSSPPNNTPVVPSTTVGVTNKALLFSLQFKMPHSVYPEIVCSDFRRKIRYLGHMQ